MLTSTEHFEILFQREHTIKTNLNLGTYAKDDGRIFFATMNDGKVLLLNAGKICKDVSSLACCGGQAWRVRQVGRTIDFFNRGDVFNSI